MEKYRYSPQERVILEGLRQPFAVYQLIDERIVPVLLSDGFRDLFGFESLDQAYAEITRELYKNVHPDDTARIADAALRFATADERYEVIYRARPIGQEDYTIIHSAGRHVITETGVRLAQIWYTDEGVYTNREGANRSGLNETLCSALHEKSLLRANHYDDLTGLPGMSYFFSLAEAGKAALQKAGEVAVLLYMDLNGMKYYNHRNGFQEGDRLLRALAGLLAQIFGRDSCCHIASDRFAVYTRQEGLEDALQLLFRQARELNGGKSLPLRVGIYSTAQEDLPISNAFDLAKITCDTVRKSDLSAFRYYSSELRENLERSRYIVSSIDRAIAEKWIRVYYQPIVRATNGRVCDEEALARWIDPVRGFLSPADFIPSLEAAGLIYKLDLYVLDQVLEKIVQQKESGLHIVPHSINLSRSDFDACDIVEEIRRRVDAAGVSRDRITIEITESVIGRDFEFMKTQVERFQGLGFPVWMDDFGSGYSSLDVLQSIKFNLLKFDMGFLRRLNESESARIILTELMKMATSLGVDTVCEGVETAEQVRFLQEIGCSKLQGYYYCKPIPPEQIIERNRQGIQIGYENPAESEYFEAISRVNLYDLGVISSEDESDFQRYFNTLPVAILEIRDGTWQYVRSNQSYRDFVKRFFDQDLSGVRALDGSPTVAVGRNFLQAIRQCCRQRNRAFFDEQMPDGTMLHFFVRRIGVNPVSGGIALAIAVLSVSDPDEDTSYADIARALAADYYNIYVVDLDTDRFIEYRSSAGGEDLAMERHGKDFFTSARRDTMTRIYEEDQAFFLSWFTKENIVRELDAQGVFTTTYRLVDTGAPLYANMKITRMQAGGNRIIMGISIVDSQMKRQEETERLRQERVIMARIVALSGGFYALYTVDPETGRYYEYSATADYEGLGLEKVGEDFFRRALLNAEKVILAEDLPMYRAAFTQENILRTVRKSGLFLLRYRLLINGTAVPVWLRAALIHEHDGEKLIVGVKRAEDQIHEKE